MTFLNLVWEILCQLAPWMLAGTAIAGLLHVFLPPQYLRHSLRGHRGVFKAVLLGVPLPLCSCGVIPTGIGLKKNGASDGASVGFLISTPQTGVDSILVSASFLGWPFAVFKLLAAAVTGVIGGILTNVAVPETEAAPVDTGVPLPRKGIADFFSHSLEILGSIWFWLLLGVCISALISEFVPETAFEKVNSWGILPALLLVLLISTPLYVCATASVPIAAALVAGGLPPSVALVFLMAGPATNVATITSIYGSFGWKTTAIYLSTIITGSVLFALMFDWIITVPARSIAAHSHHTNSWWEPLTAIILLGIFGWLAWKDTRRIWHKWVGKKVELHGRTAAFAVEGMSCEGCLEKLEKSIRKVPGVKQVQAQLKPGKVDVIGDCNQEAILKAIQHAGFLGKPTSEKPA